jgi:hypothetical protein
MTQEQLAKLYQKGYRFLIMFEANKIEPLAVKTLTEIGPLMRTQYPEQKKYCAQEFDASGRLIAKWKPTVVDYSVEP